MVKDSSTIMVKINWNKPCVSVPLLLAQYAQNIAHYLPPAWSKRWCGLCCWRSSQPVTICTLLSPLPPSWLWSSTAPTVSSTVDIHYTVLCSVISSNFGRKSSRVVFVFFLNGIQDGGMPNVRSFIRLVTWLVQKWPIYYCKPIE